MAHYQSLKSQGFSLLELLLVLGVIAALAIAAFVVYPGVQASNQARAEIANLNTMQAGIRSLYMYSNGKYEGLTNTSANEAHVVPKNLNGGISAGGTIINSWGGAVTLGEFANGSAVPLYYTIVYEDVPQAACLKLLPSIVENFYGVVTDGTEPIVMDSADLSGIGAAGTDAFSPSLMGGHCSNPLMTITMYGR